METDLCTNDVVPPTSNDHVNLQLKLNAVQEMHTEKPKILNFAENPSQLRKRCNYLEMQSNRSCIVIRNVLDSKVDDRVVFSRICNKIGFLVASDTLEYIRPWKDKNEFKRLEVKFFTVKDKINFGQLFYDYGTLRNYHIGFNCIEIINVKEKLTKENNHLYYLANQMLKAKEIKGFETCNGFVYILPRNLPWRVENFVRIINVNFLNQYKFECNEPNSGSNSSN